MENRKMVLIRWMDTKGLSEDWEYLNEITPMPPSECLTVGFIVEDCPDYVNVAGTISMSQVLGRISIPKRAIIERLEVDPEQPTEKA